MFNNFKFVQKLAIRQEIKINYSIVTLHSGNVDMKATTDQIRKQQKILLLILLRSV